MQINFLRIFCIKLIYIINTNTNNNELCCVVKVQSSRARAQVWQRLSPRRAMGAGAGRGKSPGGSRLWAGLQRPSWSVWWPDGGTSHSYRVMSPKTRRALVFDLNRRRCSRTDPISQRSISQITSSGSGLHISCECR